MPAINRIAEFSDDMAAWRRHIHAHPELDLECHETAAFVAERLRAFGVDRVETGIGVSGVVGVIEGRGPGRGVGLRADMDALPMQERTGAPHASTIPGRMHACGHDGHTAMLLGAARYLAETRNFAGQVVLIFQPAEELSGGARYMIEDGLFDRFDIDEVYALHSLPGLPVGHFETRPGPIMAAADDWRIDIQGIGGHAAHPDTTADPLMVAVTLAQALQTIVSRNLDPIETGVLSITQIHGGTALNVIPESAMLAGTVRTFRREVRAMIRARMEELVHGLPRAFGGSATLTYNEGYPATVNDPGCTAFAAEVAAEIGPVDAEAAPTMGAEDFSYMLAQRPGAFLYVGNGDTAELHHPEYDFDDAAAPYGASLLARLAERALGRGAG